MVFCPLRWGDPHHLLQSLCEHDPDPNGPANSHRSGTNETRNDPLTHFCELHCQCWISISSQRCRHVLRRDEDPARWRAASGNRARRLAEGRNIPACERLGVWEVLQVKQAIRKHIVLVVIVVSVAVCSIAADIALLIEVNHLLPK